jgi:import inner membrane translocase subunit TIM13
MRACLSRYIVSLYPNATHLLLTIVQKLNEHCFERCVPKPGTSLSKGEENCFTACMEKYMSAWNTVSKQYVGRIQKEQQNGAVQNL